MSAFGFQCNRQSGPEKYCRIFNESDAGDFRCYRSGPSGARQQFQSASFIIFLLFSFYSPCLLLSFCLSVIPPTPTPLSRPAPIARLMISFVFVIDCYGILGRFLGDAWEKGACA